MKVLPRFQNQDVLLAGARATAPIFIAAIIFSFFINLLMFVSPLYMLQIYDRVITSRSEPTLIALTVLAAVLICVYAILEMLRSRLLVRAGLLFDEKMAAPLFNAVHRGNLREPGANHVQGLRDLDTLREFLTGPGLIALCDAPWFPIFVFASFLLHPLFGYLALAGSAITLSLTFLNEKVTKAQINSAGRASMMASQSAQSMFRNAEVLQAMGMREAVKKIWTGHHDTTLALQASASDRAGLIVAATKFFRMFLQTAILGTGAYLVIQRDLSAGGMIAGSILIGRALAPIEMAVGSWKGFIAARSALERIRHLFSVAGAEPANMSLPRPAGALQIVNLIAGAPGQNGFIIKDLSFNLSAGEIIGVVGPSAAGKSSLARLLVGVWPVARGAVRLDGSDLSHWNPEELGRYIGYLPQDVELFAGTIAQNIARFQDIDTEQVIFAAQLAGCHELIQHLPKGYNTQIGEGGQALSGGQRQRIGLARALYGRPSLVVLDEPNANLDAAGEEALLAAVQRLRAMKTTVVIVTHKINILTAVDKILVMADGAAQAFGARDAVLQSLMGPRVVATTPAPAVQAPQAATQGR
ncbi:ATP-binding cassette, subfamily C [Rhodoblastus acidophilus]|uniref:ATP-binding cassette, subfamily C n=1 Tax=Rhodoblastus acidophilus TaxID=1074 RepID=A0A212SAA8_RHOAC|nr:type I secretion system permease/ATPase [Rhodoblastus acidophilus]PPQ35922.1 type I secretion system permease/ATPase [Rhodoblastus acidophilus]RAI18278.1 type I secretion system permease/ATPase [Rhodoblastus acidophilus]SNB82240.1 ATP-binding cassette, subfamily C [Rhodoblastus acidophilus]